MERDYDFNEILKKAKDEKGKSKFQKEIESSSFDSLREKDENDIKNNLLEKEMLILVSDEIKKVFDEKVQPNYDSDQCGVFLRDVQQSFKDRDILLKKKARESSSNYYGSSDNNNEEIAGLESSTADIFKWVVKTGKIGDFKKVLEFYNEATISGMEPAVFVKMIFFLTNDYYNRGIKYVDKIRDVLKKMRQDNMDKMNEEIKSIWKDYQKGNIKVDKLNLKMKEGISKIIPKVSY